MLIEHRDGTRLCVVELEAVEGVKGRRIKMDSHKVLRQAWIYNFVNGAVRLIQNAPPLCPDQACLPENATFMLVLYVVAGAVEDKYKPPKPLVKMNGAFCPRRPV